MSDLYWKEQVSIFADMLERELSTHIERSILSAKLMELTIVPPSSDCAHMWIAISPDEVVLTAGQGTRFELARLPDSAMELERLIVSIASGGLTEEICLGIVSFKLRVDHETTLRGRSIGNTGSGNNLRSVRYTAYKAS